MMNTAFCKKFREEAEAALVAVGEKMGVEIKVGKISYSENELKANVIAIEIPNDGKSVEQVQFEKYAKTFGFSNEDYLAEIRIGDKDFLFIGINPSAHKNRCLLRNISNNKTYCTSSTIVKECIARNEKENKNGK